MTELVRISLTGPQARWLRAVGGEAARRTAEVLVALESGRADYSAERRRVAAALAKLEGQGETVVLGLTGFEARWLRAVVAERRARLTLERAELDSDARIVDQDQGLAIGTLAALSERDA